MHLPSAGIIRFRFDGFASLHLSRWRLPEVGPRIGENAVGARGRMFGVYWGSGLAYWKAMQGASQ